MVNRYPPLQHNHVGHTKLMRQYSCMDFNRAIRDPYSRKYEAHIGILSYGIKCYHMGLACSHMTQDKSMWTSSCGYCHHMPLHMSCCSWQGYRRHEILHVHSKVQLSTRFYLAATFLDSTARVHSIQGSSLILVSILTMFNDTVNKTQAITFMQICKVLI